MNKKEIKRIALETLKSYYNSGKEVSLPVILHAKYKKLARKIQKIG